MTELTYTEIDGLLYPNIEIDDEKLFEELGKYGEMRLEYLQEHKPRLYSELLITGKLAQHCTEIDKVAFVRSEQIQAVYLETHPVPSKDFWQRVQTRTQAKDIADEIVKSELIYT